MELKSLTEFHEQSPEGATHVLRLGDKYEYAWFDGQWYNGQSPIIDLSKAFEPNDGFYFKVSDRDWSVHIKL
jgi:hypothetical protein